MSVFDDYVDEMAERDRDDVVEALISGVADFDDPVVPALDALRDLTARSVDDEVAAAHVAMAIGAVSPGVELSPAPARSPLKRRRRRIVFTTFASSVIAKVLAASVAFAAVGGVGVAANAAVPGSPLYGLDRAMEKVGIANGGAAERISEAQQLYAQGRAHAAAEVAGEAVADLAAGSGNATAKAALEAAAQQIIDAGRSDSAGFTSTQELRDQVGSLLGVISTQMDAGSHVDGQVIAEHAKAFAATARALAEARGQANDNASPGADASAGGSANASTTGSESSAGAEAGVHASTSTSVTAGPGIVPPVTLPTPGRP